MKQLLVISVFLLISTTELTFGCLAIDHYRTFPIGTSTEGLVVFETYMFRNDNGEKWTGITNLNIYDSTFHKVKSIFLDSILVIDTTLVLKSKYINALNNSFSQAIEIAKSMNGFILAKPTYLSICEYQQNCKVVSLQADTINSKFFLLLKDSRNKVELSLLTDTTNPFYEYLLGIGSAYETTFNELAEQLSINSIRKYKIGNRMLLVTHLGESVQILYKEYDEMIARHRIEYKPELNYTDINQSIFY